MFSYVIINGELYHHGVKGMKWGVRRAKRKEARIKRKHAKIDKELTRRNQELKDIESNRRYDRKQIDLRYSGKKALNKKAYIDANYDYEKIILESRKARLKAAKDPSYKNSKEYIRATTAYGKQRSNMWMYGESGTIRIKTLHNRGYTDAQAKGRVAVEQTLNTIGVLAASTVVGYVINKLES